MGEGLRRFFLASEGKTDRMFKVRVAEKKYRETQHVLKSINQSTNIHLLCTRHYAKGKSYGEKNPHKNSLYHPEAYVAGGNNI